MNWDIGKGFNIKFKEFCNKFYIDNSNIGGIGNEARFIGALFFAAGSKFFPERPKYGKDDTSYQGHLFRGSKHLSQSMKDSFPDQINEEKFVTYFAKRINPESLKKISINFGIEPDIQINMDFLLLSLYRQFQKFIFESGDSVDDIVAKEYNKLVSEPNPPNTSEIPKKDNIDGQCMIITIANENGSEDARPLFAPLKREMAISLQEFIESIKFFV